MPRLGMNPQISVWLDGAMLDAFLERMKAVLPPVDYELVKGLVDTIRFLLGTLQRAKTSIKRLREMVFGSKTEKTSEVLKDSPEATPENPPEAEEEPAPVKKKKKGHGRNGREDYPGGKKTRIDHESLKHGDLCPCCKRGRVYEVGNPGIFIFFKGQAPILAELFEQEKLRCNGCGEVFTAKLPEGIGEEKYDPTAGSMLSLMRYGSGFPLYRFQKLEGNLGIPFPVATQWEILAKVAARIGPVFWELIRLAAQGQVLYIDDTVMRILEISKEIAQRKLLPKPVEEEGDEDEAGKEKERTGIFTSAVVSEAGDHRIALFFTGTKHAGENLAGVLAQREKDLAPPIKMSDGLDRNTPKDVPVVDSNCLTHGRRNFVKIVEDFPPECRFVIECVKGVYEIEAEAKERGHSPEERLRLHQEKSGPIMEALDAWLEWKIEGKVIEPNSSLGQAIKYMRKRWARLTLFLRIAGAPIDNNLAERILKMAIIHRKNSYFYKTPNGARVGDLLMSVINTCRLEGVNAFEYLTDLQRHADRVRASPAEWLPWNYKSTLAGLLPEARAG
jgi:transposase